MVHRHFRDRSLLTFQAKPTEQSLFWIASSLLVVFSAIQVPELLILVAIALAFYLRFPETITTLSHHPLLHRYGRWKIIGVLTGVLLFAGITGHTEPATAQLFNTAEQQANSIFGEYLDQSIISFLFGMLRIVVWISAVGFIFFAVYQAQRGEQWQPLLQNAFIIVAAVVVVEGLSRLFFGRS